MKDPIVEEVRKYRMEHTEEFKRDLADICRDLRKIQIDSGHRIVRMAVRRKRTGKNAGGDKRASH